MFFKFLWGGFCFFFLVFGFWVFLWLVGWVVCLLCGRGRGNVDWLVLVLILIFCFVILGSLRDFLGFFGFFFSWVFWCFILRFFGSDGGAGDVEQTYKC